MQPHVTTWDSDGVAVIVHMSDIHFGAHIETLVESLLTDVAKQQPDLVVISGDLTQRARPKQFEQARSFLDRLSVPLLTVVGNHDLSLFNLPRRFLSETRRYERYITPDLDPVVALPGLIAVGLDTMPAWRWKSGHVSPRQAEIVRDAFEGAPTEAWRLLVTHHPVLPEEGSRLVGRRVLLKACAHAGVSVLLSGHTHVASMNVVPLDERGRHWAVAVGSGTTLSHRTRGTPNAYGVLHLSNATGIGASVTLDIRQAEGADWSVGRRTQFVYTSNGVATFDPNSE
jgi:3',5'-cyclic AMP phosphodiesterase CpdA